MTDTSKYPLASSSWDGAEISALHRVIESGRFTMGAEVAAFERQFAEYVGSSFAVMVNSGSSANLLAMAALRYRRDSIPDGAEVIVPAVSWPTTFYPVTQNNLTLRFVDIDIDTLNFDLDALERAITRRTRAVFAVNLLGNPNQFDRIRELINGRDIELVEDNCESLGASFDGRAAGTHGLMGTFSFFFSHHISTMEGGMVVTDDEELFHILLSLRAHGWTRELPVENHVTGRKSEDPFEELFRFALPGYNLRPLEMSGALGQEQLRKLDQFVEARRENAVHFVDALSGNPHFSIQTETGRSSWFGFALIIRRESGLVRKQVIDHLRRCGIETRPIVAGNFIKNPVATYLPHSISGELKNAEHIDRSGFFVGNHHYDVREQIDYLVECLGQAGR